MTIDKTVKPGQSLESTVHSHANYNPDLDNSLLKDGIDGNNVPSSAPFGTEGRLALILITLQLQMGRSFSMIGTA